MVGFLGALWILLVLKLPINTFTLLIKLAAGLDLLLSATQSTLDLDNIKIWELELTEALLDISIYLALALAFIAYCVVNGEYSIGNDNLYLVTFLSMIPGLVHIALFFLLPAKICDWLHASNVTICFAGILYLYGIVLLKIRNLQKMNEFMSKRPSFGAKDLLFRLVICLTVVNVLTWIPHMVIAWYAVNNDFVPNYSTGVLYWEKVMIAIKGAFHAAAVAYALYYDPHIKVSNSTELDVMRNTNNLELEVAVTAKDEGYKLPQVSYQPFAYEVTVKDYV